MAVHNVEQSPPNGRKKTTSSVAQQENSTTALSADRFGEFEGTGKCSTCGGTFSTAQQFYEHLDDCVLRLVVQPEPAAEINEMNLNQIKLEDIAESLGNSWKSHQKGDDEKGEDEEDEDEGADAEEGDEREEKDDSWALSRDISKQTSKTNGLGRASSTKSKTTKIRGVR